MNKLYKSKSNKIFFGVCAGLGYSFNLDPVLIRIFFILGTIFSGSLLFWIYLVLGLILPTRDE